MQLVFNTMTKTRLIELVNLVHWMGGQVKEQIEKGQCDRLVANHLRGPKFRRAVSLDIAIVSCDYVHDCWTLMRQLPFFRAADKERFYDDWGLNRRKKGTFDFSQTSIKTVW